MIKVKPHIQKNLTLSTKFNAERDISKKLILITQMLDEGNQMMRELEVLKKQLFSKL